MSIDRDLCVASAFHSPGVVMTDRHHVKPRYLCALLGIATIAVTVPLCASCHQTTHHLLEHLISTGETTGHHWKQMAVAPWVAEAWDWWVAQLLLKAQ